MSSPSRQENVAAGMERLDAIVDSFDASLLDAVDEAAFAERGGEQPWLIAGVSDGMGLHVTLAALEAGLIEQGVGVYFEPDALLKLEDDGEPVSPVHWARYQNALALEEFARQRGADFTVLQSDMLLAPQRGLKGDVKGDIPDFPDDVRQAVEEARSKAPLDDVVFIDSVAFGKWICPREGNEPVEVPSVDFEGRVISTKTKKYHPRGYNETIDTMGRNHRRLLEKCREFGWLGEEALTAFFTWAGGSQNVEVLEGIYGRGALGDAKIVAERDVVEFRLEHGLELGEHAIVRLPAFLSAALMAIPGGGLFGLVSQKIMRDHGVYRDMPELAVRMMRRLFDTEWVRDNPIAQIELDSNEVLHLPEISDAVAEAHERIAEFRAGQTDEERREPIPAGESARLLEGLVPWNYRRILNRFRPGEEDEIAGEFSVATAETAFRGHLEAPVTATMLQSASVAGELPDIVAGRRPSWITESLDIEVDEWPADLPDEIRGTVHVEVGEDPETVTLVRVLFDRDGGRIGEGRTTLGFGGGGPSVEDARDWIGEPAGSNRELSGSWTDDLLDEAVGGLDDLRSAGALAGFAESALRVSGRTGGLPVSYDWQIDCERLPSGGETIVTYARRTDGCLEATVVDGDGETILRGAYRDE